MKKLLFFLIPLIVFGILFWGDAKAGSSDNVSGYAWSENIGWISFNCTNQGTCGAVDYGVNIEQNGKFSGYAWSENIGWIDFAPSGPYPAQPNYSAKLIAENQVSGWARVLSYGGGWEGWIKLSDTDYGISIDSSSGDFSGWAWSDVVVGWISFSGVSYRVTTSFSFNQPPDKPGIPPEGPGSGGDEGDGAFPEGEEWEHCSFQNLSLPTLYWTYSDPDGDPQTAYEIRIDNDSDFSVIDGDEYQCGGVICSGGASTAYTPIPADWSDWMDWGTNYWWIVRVKDDHDNWSEWSDVNQFVTFLHAYPSPDFSHQPAVPTAGEEITFTDSSVCYNAGGSSYSCKDNVGNRYQWDFEDDDIIDCDSNINPDCRGNATATYEEAGDYIARLYVTNELGTCDTTGDTPISTSFPLPEYKEVPPIYLRDKFLAKILFPFQNLLIF